MGADLTAEERLLRAHDLGISAFLGESIYNFGELVGCSCDLKTTVFKAGARGRLMLTMISSVLADASDIGRAGQHAV